MEKCKPAQGDKSRQRPTYKERAAEYSKKYGEYVEYFMLDWVEHNNGGIDFVSTCKRVRGQLDAKKCPLQQLPVEAIYANAIKEGLDEYVVKKEQYDKDVRKKQQSIVELEVQIKALGGLNMQDEISEYEMRIMALKTDLSILKQTGMAALDAFQYLGLDYIASEWEHLQASIVCDGVSVHYTPEYALNEHEIITSSASFSTLDGGLVAMSATLMDRMIQIEEYAKTDMGWSLSSEALLFWTFAAYNGGVKKTKEMMQTYSSAGAFEGEGECYLQNPPMSLYSRVKGT